MIQSLKRFTDVFRYSKKALVLVWETSPVLAVVLGALTLVAGLVPALIAYVGQLIVDSVVAAMADPSDANIQQAVEAVLMEAGLVVLQAAAQRGLAASQSILRALLGQRVNVMILDKAQTLSLTNFEDSEFYDKLTRARMDASQRPLALVNKTFGFIQNSLSIAGFSALLIQFSPWAILILVIGALPGFIAEAKFSTDAFQIFRWRSPDQRMRLYLETLLTREDSIKEVQLFNLGGVFAGRYKAIFRRMFAEDKQLTLRRESWGFGLGVVSSVAFYGAYGWVIWETIHSRLTLGQMTMYLLVFKQGQAAISSMLTSISGMYEDNLYLSNLYDYLGEPVEQDRGTMTQGAIPDDGIRFENVSFSYPNSEKNALSNVSFHLKPGERLAIVGENGSGKTTLIKLLTRLYRPSSGRVLLDGTDLNEWSEAALRKRVGVIFQDFVRYQLTVGENIGAGDVEHFEDEPRWTVAAEQGQANEFIEAMGEGYRTQLGRWFKGGQELSGGQWQKIALSRAFMRRDADVLVLDEPTSAMDAEAEAELFERFTQYADDKMVVLISHRFSTVRHANQILVINQGQIIESGDHKSLVDQGGRYAELFNLQAKGYA